MIDYDVGDVVVCVDDRPCSCCGEPMPFEAGKTYRASAVKESYNRLLKYYLGVSLNGVDMRSSAHPRATACAATRFRKLPKATDEFTEQMRRLKPKAKPRAPQTVG